MLRINRNRVIGIICLLLFVYYLVVSDSATTTDFRAKTEAGLARKNTLMQGKLSDEEYTHQTVETLERILATQPNVGAMDASNGESTHNSPSTDAMAAQGVTREEPGYKHNAADADDEISIAGRKKMPRPPNNNNKDASKPKYSTGDDKSSQASLGNDEETSSAEDPAKDRAREKLTEYLKNPIVIFSKSYCPHSRKAKELLLDIYAITPTPLVVELDLLHDRLPAKAGEQSVTMGAALQDLLKEVTGRRTVPNILVGGLHSIGGNDIIWQMHDNGLLGAEIQKYGGKRITGVDLKENVEKGS